MSAIAPAGVETSATGSINDVWTRATISAEEVICVIVQAAPTPRTKMPRLDSRLAVHMRRNTGKRRGEKMPRADGARLFEEMRIISANVARQAQLNSPFAIISRPANNFSWRVISRHDRARDPGPV